MKLSAFVVNCDRKELIKLHHFHQLIVISIHLLEIFKHTSQSPSGTVKLYAYDTIFMLHVIHIFCGVGNVPQYIMDTKYKFSVERVSRKCSFVRRRGVCLASNVYRRSHKI